MKLKKGKIPFGGCDIKGEFCTKCIDCFDKKGELLSSRRKLDYGCLFKIVLNADVRKRNET